MPPDLLQWLHDTILELRNDFKEFRDEYKQDELENREIQKEMFQRLNALEKQSHPQPCSDLKDHQDDHRRRDERWWSGVIKPVLAGVVGYLFARYGLK
ncbi:TPA: hypothetical protein DDW35_08180 [Candidatus Sumerlaeota bacterium]|jgi:hypothetical protein|nr:hypothetical protein [Candidatus Sumerlaeota bacterium]